MKKVLYLLLIITQTSCNNSFFINYLARKKSIEKEIKVYENNNQKRIVYLPMVHLGKEEFYASVKSVVDSLRKKNYIILYEGIGSETANDSIKRKFRKVAGFTITNYKDSTNQSIPKIYRKNKLIHQTRENTGIYAKEDINADYSLDSLVYEYEKRYKKIILNDCDFETPLLAKYECKDSINYSSYKLINELRNDRALETIERYKNMNIVILYGKAHRFMLHADILDLGYTLVEGKL